MPPDLESLANTLYPHTRFFGAMHGADSDPANFDKRGSVHSARDRRSGGPAGLSLACRSCRSGGWHPDGPGPTGKWLEPGLGKHRIAFGGYTAGPFRCSQAEENGNGILRIVKDVNLERMVSLRGSSERRNKRLND